MTALLERTLHVIDVENLVGGSRRGAEAVAPALDAYRRRVRVHAGDHAVLGSGPTLAVAAGFAWPGAQLRVGHGVDGADRALLACLDADFLARRYGRVVIASGDHAFAGLATGLRVRGLTVQIVVGDRRSCARVLEQASMHRPLALAS